MVARAKKKGDGTGAPRKAVVLDDDDEHDDEHDQKSGGSTQALFVRQQTGHAPSTAASETKGGAAAKVPTAQGGAARPGATAVAAPSTDTAPACKQTAALAKNFANSLPPKSSIGSSVPQTVSAPRRKPLLNGATAIRSSGPPNRGNAERGVAAVATSSSQEPRPAREYASATKRGALDRLAQLKLDKIDQLCRSTTSLFARAPAHIPRVQEQARITKSAMHRLRDGLTTVEHYDHCVIHLVDTIGALIGAIEAADGAYTQAPLDAHLSLGLTAAQALSEMVPKINSLQRSLTGASTAINTLSGMSTAWAARLSKDAERARDAK